MVVTAAMVSRIAWMAVMKTLLLAKTTAFISFLQPGIIAIMVVVFEQK